MRIEEQENIQGMDHSILEKLHPSLFEAIEHETVVRRSRPPDLRYENVRYQRGKYGEGQRRKIMWNFIRR